MQALFGGALTPCPACKQDVLLTDIHCPHCDAAADTTSSFLSFKRPDGSAGMIDQLTVAYLRSQHSQPAQTDLDQLFATTARIQFMEMVFEDRTGRFQPRLEFTKTDDLSALRRCLVIEASTGHAMMMGEFCFEFYHLDGLVARIEIVGTGLLRWSDRWKNDAYLTDPLILAEFLKSHGFAKLRETIDRDAEAEIEIIAAHAAWVATWEPAIPAGLAPLIVELSEEIYAPEPQARPRALALLAAQYPSVDEQILALFAWYGHGSGPWSGFPSSEVAPESMLESFAVEQLVHALESQNLSRQHLEGAARFVSRWVSKPSQRVHRELINRFRTSRMRHQILSYVQSTEDSSKIEAITRILG
jgi:hypothetical protein